MNELDLGSLPRTLALVEKGARDGLHIGFQLYASINGQPRADWAWGESRPGVAMTHDSITLWLSSGKPAAAVAVLQLRDRGLLGLDDPVARHIPEFGQNGKQDVTIRQLLTHTGGFRWIDIGGPELSREEVLQRIYHGKLDRNWTPGQRAGYHPQTSWHILGELVHRLDGRLYRDYVRQAIFRPLGMRDSSIGMTREEIAAYGTRLGVLVNTETPGSPPQRWSTEAGILLGPPGGAGHGPIRELAWFYEMLLGQGQREGCRVLSVESAREMTSPQRVGMDDETFRLKLDWGLGLILDSKHYGEPILPYGYGPHASPRTYGHGGAQSSIGFADPEFGLAAAFVFNGTCGEERHQRRAWPVLAALYEDLGLAGLIA